MFETKHSKTSRWQKAIKYRTNKQIRLQKIPIEICRYKYNEVLAVFASTKLALSKIKQAQSN